MTNCAGYNLMVEKLTPWGLVGISIEWVLALRTNLLLIFDLCGIRLGRGLPEAGGGRVTEPLCGIISFIRSLPFY